MWHFVSFKDIYGVITQKNEIPIFMNWLIFIAPYFSSLMLLMDTILECLSADFWTISFISSFWALVFSILLNYFW